MQRYHLHPFERILNPVYSRAPQCFEQTISDILDVSAHRGRVHSDQLHWQRACNELKFYLDCFTDYLLDSVGAELVADVVPVQETREVSVHPFVPAYQLVTKGQTRHQAPFLKPEDSAKAP